MADIRQNSVISDIFDRVESPLSNGGKWAQVDAAFPPLDDNGVRAYYPGGGYAWSYWTPDAFDGDDAESWGCMNATSGPGQAWDNLLVKDVGGSGAVDGYIYRHGRTTGGQYTELYKLTNAGGTLISGSVFGPFITGAVTMSLIRRNGTSVEGWYSPDNGATWILRETAVENTYTTGLHPGIAVFSTFTGWTCWGGGPFVARRQQIYRILSGTNPAPVTA